MHRNITFRVFGSELAFFDSISDNIIGMQEIEMCQVSDFSCRQTHHDR